MKQNQKILACLLITLAVPVFSVAQNKLILPQSQEDIRSLSKELEVETCQKCDVVTGIYRKNRAHETLAEPKALSLDEASSSTPFSRSFDTSRKTKPEVTHRIEIYDTRYRLQQSK